MHEVKERIDKVIEKFLIVIETIIAIFSVLVLVGLLVDMVVEICRNPAAFLSGADPVSDYLHHMLTIVIGLEFVKLLMHLTPANILEVLTMAISRGIIVSHGSAIDNLLSIACIIAMFAARRYLIPRNELYREIDDETPEHHHHHRGHRRHKHKEESRQEEPAQQH